LIPEVVPCLQPEDQRDLSLVLKSEMSDFVRMDKEPDKILFCQICFMPHTECKCSRFVVVSEEDTRAFSTSSEGDDSGEGFLEVEEILCDGDDILITDTDKLICVEGCPEGNPVSYGFSTVDTFRLEYGLPTTDYRKEKVTPLEGFDWREQYYGKRYSPLDLPKTVHDLKFEPVTYCRSVQFYVFPSTTPFEDARARMLFNRVCQGEYSLKMLKIGFRNVNEVLYELSWFSKAEVVSYKVSNKYLYHFFENGRQLTNLKARQVTENFRDSDAMAYWIRNYGLFLKIFTGLKWNRFTQRMSEYRKNRTYLELLHKETKKNAAVLLPKRKHTSRVVRDRCFRTQKGDSQYEGQMFQSVRNSVVDSVSDLTTDVAKKTISNMKSDLYSMVSDVITSLPKQISKFASGSFDSGVSALSKLSEFVKNIFSSIRVSVSEVLTSLSESEIVKDFVLPLCVFLFILVVYIYRDYFSSLISMIVICVVKFCNSLGCNIASDDARKLADLFKNEEYVGHNLSAIAPIVGTAVGIALSVTNKNASQTAGAALNFASRFTPTFTSLEDCLYDCFDFMYHIWTGRHYFPEKNTKDDMKLFLEHYRDIITNPDCEKRLERDIEFAKRVATCYEESKPLLAMLPLMKLPPVLSGEIAKAAMRIKSMADTSRKISNLYNTRVETCLLWLYGKPGQGKTTVIEHVLAAVYKDLQNTHPDVLPDTWSRALVHNRAKSSQFWEGYDGQFATVWNEHGSMRC
jgi:hypothetical protein